jgi:tRNA-dihydrouridine synthase
MLSEEKLSHYREKAIAMTERKFFSVVEFRKFLFNYVKGIPGSKEFKVRVSQINEYEILKQEIDKFLHTESTNKLT